MMETTIPTIDNTTETMPITSALYGSDSERLFATTAHKQTRCSSWAHWKARSGVPISDN